MTNVRAGLGIVLALTALAASGCGAAQTVEEAAAVEEVTPASELQQAVPGEDSAAYHFVVKGGTQPMEGVIDAASEALRIEIAEKDPDLGFTVHMKWLLVDDKAWMKINFTGTEGLDGLPQLPAKWLLLDPSKLNEDVTPTYEGEQDPGAVGAVVSAATAVSKSATGEFTGTTDLTKQGDAGIVSAETLKALGDKAKAVPFEASVDGQGRVTHAVVKVPAAGKEKAATYEVTYDGYGTADKPAVPAAGEQQKAPELAYELLNS